MAIDEFGMDDEATCAVCGETLEIVRPGKYQCNTCDWNNTLEERFRKYIKKQYPTWQILIEPRWENKIWLGAVVGKFCYYYPDGVTPFYYPLKYLYIDRYNLELDKT